MVSIDLKDVFSSPNSQIIYEVSLVHSGGRFSIS